MHRFLDCNSFHATVSVATVRGVLFSVLYNQTMAILKISDIVADFESRFGECPVRAEVGSGTWEAIVKYFGIPPKSQIKVMGMPITVNERYPANIFDVYLANGACRRYYFKVD